MICKNGHDNPEGAKFCGICGITLEDSAKKPKRKSPLLLILLSFILLHLLAVPLIQRPPLLDRSNIPTEATVLSTVEADNLPIACKNILDMSKLPVKKETLYSIHFLDTLKTLPEKHWDISQAQNGTVLCWVQPSGKNSIYRDEDYELYDLYIAAEGGVYAPANASNLFRGYKNLTTIHFNDIFYTDDIVNMEGMFAECHLEELDVTNFNTSNVTNMKDLFYVSFDYNSAVSLDLSKWDTSNVTNMSGMFSCCYVNALNLRGIDTSNVIDMSSMFFCFGTLDSLDLRSFDTSKVTNMNRMFMECRDLTSLNLNNFNTSCVTDMSEMFRSCELLKSLDLGSFDTSKVTNMRNMFDCCHDLKNLDFRSFDTTSVTDMSEMFSYCMDLTKLDLSLFDTSNVVNMSGMFSNCLNLSSLKLSCWNTSSATNMSRMFAFCDSLKQLDLSGFDMSNVTNYEYMLPEHLTYEAVGLHITNH